MFEADLRADEAAALRSSDAVRRASVSLSNYTGNHPLIALSM